MTAACTGSRHVMKGDQVEYVHKFNQELRLTSDAGNTLFGHGFDWQIGGFFTHESTTLTQPFEALDATDPSTILAPALGGAIIPGDYKEHSFFADITYHFNTRIRPRTRRTHDGREAKLAGQHILLRSLRPRRPRPFRR